MHARTWVLALAGLLLLTGCNAAIAPSTATPAPATAAATAVPTLTGATPVPGSLTLLATVLATDDLSVFGSALVAAGIAPELDGATPYTLLAPTDAAFAALPAGTLDALRADPAALVDVLRYHLVAGATPATDLARLGTALTVQGESLMTSLSQNAELVVNNARVVEADISATNGVIHKIDAVLLPTTAQALLLPTATPAAVSPVTETTPLTGAAALSPSVGVSPTAPVAAATPVPTAAVAVTTPVTATTTVTPTEATTATVPTTATLPGVTATTGMTTAPGVTTAPSVTTAAGVTTTAVVTTIVGGPAANAMALTLPVTTSAAGLTIVDVLTERSDLSMASTALATAGLAEALALPGPFTYFASTDAAFNRIGAAERQALLNDIPRLARTMQYHTVAGRVPAEELARLGTALTTMGQSITISTGPEGGLLANGAPILESIEAGNGIVHVIDGILIPANP